VSLVTEGDGMGLAVAIGPRRFCPKYLLNVTDKYLTEPSSIHSPDGLKVGKRRLIRKLELSTYRIRNSISTDRRGQTTYPTIGFAFTKSHACLPHLRVSRPVSFNAAVLLGPGRHGAKPGARVDAYLALNVNGRSFLLPAVINITCPSGGSI